MSVLIDSYPASGDLVPVTANFRVVIEDVVDIYSLDIDLYSNTSTLEIMRAGVFNITNVAVSNSIVEADGNNNTYKIIIDLNTNLQFATAYVLNLRYSGSIQNYSVSINFETAQEFNDPHFFTTHSYLRHILYSFPITQESRLDNIEGFKFDETFFTSEKLLNKEVGLTSLWDADVNIVDEELFKSGIGYGDDIKPSDLLVSRRVGTFDHWSIELTHGAYYISKYLNYLYSDEAFLIKSDLFEIVNNHTEIQLESSPKSGIPIFLGYYSKIIGNYIPSNVDQKYQFTPKDFSHNTFCCKYCNGSNCTYLETHPFQQSYNSEFMGKDYSSYYDNSLFGRCDNTSCPGHILDNIYDNILWDNVDTSNPEFIYTRDNKRIVCNISLEDYYSDNIQDAKLYDYTNGAEYQWVETDNRNISNVKVYLNGTPLVSGYTVDEINGRIRLSHNDIVPMSLRNTYGYAIRIAYRYNFELIFEPSDSSDTYIPVDLNLNPLYSGITRGFVSMLNASLEPHNVVLETAKLIADYTIYDPESGSEIPVYGPLYIGNDYGYLISTVTDKSNMYGIANVPVTFHYSDYGNYSESKNYETKTHTNAEGKAFDVYTAPPNSDDQLVYIKLTTDSEAEQLGFGTTSFGVHQNTIMLPYTVPKQCIVNNNGDVLIDIFAVYKDDPSLGVDSPDYTKGEVLFEDNGLLGKAYKTNGRKEIMFRWDDINNEFVKIIPAKIGESYLLYNEDKNLCVNQTDNVKYIVYGEGLTSSYLPHNTDNLVGAYVLTIPRYIFVYTEINVGEGDVTYPLSSNKIAFEIQLPDYMRGIFTISNSNLSDSKSFDGATYFSFDPMAKWDLSSTILDPRLLGHTILTRGEASINTLGKDLLSLRQLIRIYGDSTSALRHYILSNRVHVNALRHILYAGNLATSSLRHTIDAVLSNTVGFDFVLDLVDPPSDGFDIEFNMHTAKSGGTDPTNPINIEFVPTGSTAIVGPSSQDWPRYNSGISGDSAGVAGGSNESSPSGCMGSFPTTLSNKLTSKMYVLVYEIPEMTGENKNNYNKKVFFRLTSHNPESAIFDNTNSMIGIWHRFVCDSADQFCYKTNSNNFTETWKAGGGSKGGELCFAETHIFNTLPLYPSTGPVMRDPFNSGIPSRSVLFSITWDCYNASSEYSLITFTNEDVLAVDGNAYAVDYEYSPKKLHIKYFYNDFDTSLPLFPWWPNVGRGHCPAVITDSNGTPLNSTYKSAGLLSDPPYSILLQTC